MYSILFKRTAGDSGNVIFGLNVYQTAAATSNAIGNLPYLDQNTNTTGGLYWARQIFTNLQYGARSNVPRIIVLITDGIPTVDVNLLPAEYTLIKSLGIRIVCIGITNQVCTIAQEATYSD